THLHQGVDVERGDVALIKDNGVTKRDRLGRVGLVAEEIEPRSRPSSIMSEPTTTLREIDTPRRHPRHAALGAGHRQPYAKRNYTRGDRPRSYAMPSFALPSGEIMLGFHGGSHTTWTCASATPGKASMRRCASIAIEGPMPQPCAVSVI